MYASQPCRKGHRFLLTKSIADMLSSRYNLERQCQDCLKYEHCAGVSAVDLVQISESLWPFVDGVTWYEGKLPKELT